jgi:hypothetical protein
MSRTDALRSIVFAIVAIALGACQTARPGSTAGSRLSGDAISRSGTIVLAPESTRSTSADSPGFAGIGWEAFRNDSAMSMRPPMAFTELRWVEVTSYERLRTVNGRPTESTTTTTRSVRRAAEP